MDILTRLSLVWSPFFVILCKRANPSTCLLSVAGVESQRFIFSKHLLINSLTIEAQSKKTYRHLSEGSHNSNPSSSNFARVFGPFVNSLLPGGWNAVFQLKPKNYRDFYEFSTLASHNKPCSLFIK